MAEPAYTRLGVDERRRRLLDRAAELYAEHGYDQLSMARIAREAGISKALLYHYFSSKRDLFQAALARGAEEHLARLAPRTGEDPAQQLAGTLDAWLEWIDGHRSAFLALQRSAGIPEVRDVIGRVRSETARRILDALGGEPTPKLRAAVHGWLWYMDGVCLDWLREDDLDRDEVRDLLLGTLLGALAAAGLPPAALERLGG
jgi:AcrR family transcriptional regulator